MKHSPGDFNQAAAAILYTIWRDIVCAGTEGLLPLNFPQTEFVVAHV